MGYRYDELAPGEVYHIFSRGVERRKIFLDQADHERFVSLLVHCLPPGPIQSFSITSRLGRKQLQVASSEGLVDLLCYCLMPNHIHLLVRENVEGGTSLYMQRLLTSYSRYFNTRYDRSGSLFIHPFKAVLVEQDEQLLHVSRYIHLNPYVAHIIKDVFVYPWSSLLEYTSRVRQPHAKCHQPLITSMMASSEYRSFVEDEADYARALADIEHLTIDYDD